MNQSSQSQDGDFDSYQIVADPSNRSNDTATSSSKSSTHYTPGSRSLHSAKRQQSPTTESGGGISDDKDNPPLLEVPEHVYAVRTGALSVLKPLTKTWLVVSIGFALTILFAAARWTELMSYLPYWFIILPSWLAHVGLIWCHVQSAKALSVFIGDANDSRQRADSRDHLDRTEYLPLLQRSLKFGVKTGLISTGIFIFEILIYIRLSKGTMSLSTVLTPLWIIVAAGALDGIICKSQHPIRVVCWLLTLCSMIMVCLKVDHGLDAIRWRYITTPIVAVLFIGSATLVYIIYGHNVGYYKLTEPQLMAGKLYSAAAILAILLVFVFEEVMPLAKPIELETRFFIVIVAPVIMSLVGMGAWVVSRDEHSQLLLYGGQAAVHPQKLRWQSMGWTGVQGKGVTTILMFGEVRYYPLKQADVKSSSMEMCATSCCTCYPYEDEEDIPYPDELEDHPYLAPSSPNGRPEYSSPEIV
ncbi:MAG: hypothetical protein SGBAC_003324 [Bacillariaceae sp.]